MAGRLLLVLWSFRQSLRLKPRRAFLTIAAIASGTFIILILLSRLEAAAGGLRERQVGRNTRAMGENIAVVWPGETSKSWRGRPPGRSIRVSADDLAYLRERVRPAVAFIGEMVSWPTALAHGSRTVHAQLVGAGWEYGEVRGHHPRPGGRFFGPIDESEQRRVIFLGDLLKKELFGDGEAVGATLRVNNSPFTVIGVRRYEVPSGRYGDSDRHHAVIPLSTFRALFGRDRLDCLLLKVERPDQMSAALLSLNEVMAVKWGYDPADRRVLGTWNTFRSSQMSDNIRLGIEILLGVIGGLALLTGGIGVASITQAVVAQRSGEFGDTMVPDGRGSWSTRPFVLGGLLYSLTGGILGVAMVGAMVGGLGLWPGEGNGAMELLGRPTLSWPIGVALTAILVTLGLLAGYFPARRADRSVRDRARQAA